VKRKRKPRFEIEPSLGKSDQDLYLSIREGPYSWRQIIGPSIIGLVFLSIALYVAVISLYGLAYGHPWLDIIKIFSCGTIGFGTGVGIMLQIIVPVVRGKRRLARDSTVTTGIITDRTMAYDYLYRSTRKPYFFILVKFQLTHGETSTTDYLLQAEVSPQIYESYPEGSRIQIKFANKNPRLALFEGEF
jgi:hypothetical protein